MQMRNPLEQLIKIQSEGFYTQTPSSYPITLNVSVILSDYFINSEYYYIASHSTQRENVPIRMSSARYIGLVKLVLKGFS